ncbi:kinesin-like protein Klp5 [Ascosphaera atra]|nr:kinesin-like protein Klp5 [Ascosphaera atra]
MPPPRFSVSPLKSALSPRKRRSLGPRKGATFAPPRKLNFGVKETEEVDYAPKKDKTIEKKRSVRWKDDVDDGVLVEFQQTPEKKADKPVMPERSTPAKLGSFDALSHVSPEADDSSPAERRLSVPSPPPSPPTYRDSLSSTNVFSDFQSAIPRRSSNESLKETSPQPPVPQPNSEANGQESRFKNGFLTKKQPDSTPLSRPPSLTTLSLTSSRAGATKPPPLQGIENRSFLNRRVSSGEFSQSSLESIDEDGGIQAPKSEAQRVRSIRSVMKRVSSGRTSIPNRRRSLSVTTPSAAAPASSENGNMFSTSQTRRTSSTSLAPRVSSIMKSRELPRHRRSTTFGDLRSLRDSAAAGMKETPLRLGSTGTSGSAVAGRRSSLAPLQEEKTPWR